MTKLFYEPKPRLYLELHITLDARGDIPFEDFQNWCTELNCDLDWRASRFSEDDVDDYHGKWFMSAKSQSRSEAVENIKLTIKELNYDFYTVLRWKVEDTLLDSKYGDVL